MKYALYRCIIFALLLLCLLFSAAASLSEEHTLDCTLDLPAMAQGEKQDGDSEIFNDYFTIMYSAKNKIDGSVKHFDDDYQGTQRLNFGGKTQPGKGMINTVCFTTAGNARVKFWWVSGGDGRQFALYNQDGDIVCKTEVQSVKNALYISEFSLDQSGTWYLGVPDGSNYLFKLTVSQAASDGQAAPARADWGRVDAPVISSVKKRITGQIDVTVQGAIGLFGGDELHLSLMDEAGNVLETRRSIAEKAEHLFTFTPSASGVYRLQATLSRADEEAKISQRVTTSFTLPLAIPVITSATNAGGGALTLAWNAVPEADSYEIYLDNVSAGKTPDTTFTLSGLSVDSRVSLTVAALRGNEKSAPSAPVAPLVTAQAQRPWFFTIFGPSTNKTDNGFIGNLNEDGFVTVFSENGKGKVQPNADDGIAFYYTPIPAEMNFTLRALVHVENWDYSNGQEGFGLLAMDSVPATGTESHLTNQYMALASKIEYYFENGKISTGGTKYSMRLGLGALAKLGRSMDTKDPILGITYPLETSAVFKTVEGQTNYNIIGNNTNPDVLGKTSLTIQEVTDFILEIQKNNTGYFITYYGENGNIIGRYKDYDPNALSLLDPDFVYAGFFAARNARATFSQVELTLIAPEDDAPPEEKDLEKIIPSISIVSGTTANKETYTLSVVPNVSGTIDVHVDEELIAGDIPVTAEIRNDYAFTLPSTGNMLLKVIFRPDPDQPLPDGKALANTKAIRAETSVTYSGVFAKLDTIHVSPSGTASGLGTIERPLNLLTAVQYVRPGQTIILAPGTYNFVTPLRIPHGMDGTAEQPIRLVASPDAESRPVLDFKGLTAGIIHGGDYWYFCGFDVTGAANGQKGFQVSGHYNTLENIHTYHNGNTGIQISRYAGSDPVSEWPSHNLILGCTSYGNADAGYEDADGFAAKLTCGEGNVFDGCVAYHNADDGFDLYAKLETGPIAPVVIRNSVAYSNGILEDGTIGGNGNGFKLGGSNIPGGHRLENSYAFFNRSKGIDSNSCPDVYVTDCISYNNLRYNIAFYTNIQQDTAFVANNVISFKDASIPSGDSSEADEFKPKGSQDSHLYLNDTCFWWNGQKALNASGEEITADAFVSLEFKGVLRNEDGTINLQGFLERK